MGGQALLTWQPPTQRVDGSALPLNAIASFNVKRSNSGPSGPFVVVATLTNDKTSYQDVGLAAGSYYWEISTTDTSGTEGPASATVQKTILSPPNAPGNLAVT